MTMVQVTDYIGMPPYNAAGAAATNQADAAPVVSPAEQAYNSLCYDFPVSVTCAVPVFFPTFHHMLLLFLKLYYGVGNRSQFYVQVFYFEDFNTLQDTVKRFGISF